MQPLDAISLSAAYFWFLPADRTHRCRR